MAIATRPKKSVHHKKRVAQHHRHSKVYLRAYFPYLPMLMIAIVGIAVNSLWSNKAVLGAYSDFSSQTLLRETNKERVNNKEPQLSLDAKLTKAAQAKADDMVTHNYWSHTTPSGQQPWAFITDSGYQYQSAGENLAYGFRNSSSIISGWMSSPEHRANILREAYQQVGFGIAQSPNYQGHGPETIVVAEYAQPAHSVLGSVSDASSDPQDLKAKNVARVQTLTGSPMSALIVGLITGAALVLFILQHGFRLKRMLNEGEAFVAHHPYIDITIMLVLTVGLLLTRPGGLIH